MDTTLTDPLLGRLLDSRYVIEHRVARGGMASVYLATDTRLDRRVAVKVMHPALADDEGFVARFIREARAAAALSHPNVVSVFDQGTDGETVFLVMEYVEGRTLRDVLRERGRLTPGQALAVLEPVLSALAAAHAAGLVHRDVKPENVLLADDGRVKVADFGLARAVAAAHLTTTSSMLIGTVAYLAPELVQRGVADARADIYATGVMLFELLTGHPPYDGETALAVAYRHVHDDVPPPSKVVGGVPRRLDDLVTAATARDPDRRPGDAGVLLTRLRDVRAELGLFDPLPAPDDGERTEVVHRPGADTLVVPADQPPPGEPPAPRRRRRWPIVLAILVVLSLLAGTGGWWLASGRFTTTPRLVGLAVDNAKARATHDGLHVKVGDAVYSDTVDAGLVGTQSPKPGHRIARGGTVTLHPSKGVEEHVIPDVRGMPLARATAVLQRQKIEVGDTVQQYDDTVAKGAVISTDPPIGTKVRHGGRVKVYLSEGPQPLPVPVVKGMALQDAADAIRKAGFPDPSTSFAYSDTVPKDHVVRQDPTGGTAPKTTVITLVVSKGPQLFKVPKVTGKKVDDAKRILDDAGFKTQVYSFPGGPQKVLRQDPAAGSMQRRGTTVTLYVF